MSNQYILAIDQGTTGSTAVLADSKSFTIVAKRNIEFEQIYPNPSWVEHDLNSIMNSIKLAIEEVINAASITKSQIISIGLTNQRETTCAYDKKGNPLCNAIVWQDRRTEEFCNNHSRLYAKFKEKTGLPLDPYFSATKMNWLLHNNSKVIAAYEKQDLLLSTIDSFILYKLTNHKSFKTDASNASRTLLMDLQSTSWDNDLLDFFKIDSNLLPNIEDSFHHFGETENLDFLPDGIPINCILGDQQAALFGQSAVKRNDLKCTYGTGAFLLVNTANDIIHSKNGLLTTVAYKYKDKAVYALEGSSYIAGAAVQWLRDNLKIINKASEVEDLAHQANTKKTEDLFFFPFFTGVGAPYWKSNIKASIIGITRGTNNFEISRVCLEGIAQSVTDLIEAIEKDLGVSLNSIKVDGGACMNDLLMQIQANFSNKEIIRPSTIETTAYGVILGSAISNSSLSFTDLESIELDKRFLPSLNSYYTNKRTFWKNTLKHL